MANTFSANFSSTNTNKSLTVSSSLGIGHENVTFSFWVKIATEPASGEAQGLLKVRTTGGGSNYIDWFVTYANVGGTKRLIFHRDKPGVAEAKVNYDVTLGTANWHLIAMKYDTATFKGWYDGAEVASLSTSGVGSGGADNFSIGGFASDDGSNGFTKGLMDDVRVWSTARSDGDLASDYSAPAELVGNESNLRAYYQFNSDLTSDLTANAYTLTNNNTVTQDSDVPFVGGGGGANTTNFFQFI